jgi:hypothetical protein
MAACAADVGRNLSTALRHPDNAGDRHNGDERLAWSNVNVVPGAIMIGMLYFSLGTSPMQGRDMGYQTGGFGKH